MLANSCALRAKIAQPVRGKGCAKQRKACENSTNSQQKQIPRGIGFASGCAKGRVLCKHHAIPLANSACEARAKRAKGVQSKGCAQQPFLQPLGCACFARKARGIRTCAKQGNQGLRACFAPSTGEFGMCLGIAKDASSACLQSTGCVRSKHIPNSARGWCLLCTRAKEARAGIRNSHQEQFHR